MNVSRHAEAPRHTYRDLIQQIYNNSEQLRTTETRVLERYLFGLNFDFIARREERVESDNKLWMTAE